jgi:hypothetical protein
MTLPRWKVICGHWERVPPLSVSASFIAQSMGAARPKKKAKAVNEESEMQSLMVELGSSAGFSSEKPEWLRTAK